MNQNFQINVPMMRDQREIFDKMTKAVEDSAIRTVSFKLFESLVLFPFSEGTDLFFLMETEFSEITSPKQTFTDLRIESEAEAKRKNTKKCAVNINEIYSIFAKKAKISDDVRDNLIKRECELALNLVFPRAFGKKLLDTAIKNGKNIVIIADTIYPRETVLAMAEKCGISGKILISHEIDCGENPKYAIFEKILDKGKSSPSSHLHIGNDISADVETPIMKGAKALLLADVRTNMSKTGRIRDFARSERVFDYDTPKFLGFHLALGIYSAYIFDIPRTKTANSEFCGNAYILGFIAYGFSKLADISKFTESEREILDALSKNSEVQRGADDFIELFRRHSADILTNINSNGFDLPIKFLAMHGGSMDIGLLKNNMSAESNQKWKEAIVDSPAVPKMRKSAEQNKLEKLADKMFPPGTRVRNIADGLLLKMKKKR